MTTPKKLIVDECPDANGYYTIRVADGSPNGDIYKQPITTVYNLVMAKILVKKYNKKKN